MSIITLLVALLLSGSSGSVGHTNDVVGGSPILGSHAAAATTHQPTVDDVSSGGPTGGTHAAAPISGPPTVDDVSGGGPI